MSAATDLYTQMPTLHTVECQETPMRATSLGELPAERHGSIILPESGLSRARQIIVCLARYTLDESV